MYQVDDVDLPAALQLTQYLQMTELLEELAWESKKFIHADNAMRWFLLAQQLELTELANASTAFLKENFSHFSKEEAFLQLQQNQLVEYLKLLEHVPANQIISAVIEWVNHDADNRSSNLRDVIEHIPVNKWTDPGLHSFLEQYRVRDMLQPGVPQNSIMPCLLMFF